VNSNRRRLVEFNSAALGLLATVFFVSGEASAKDRKVKEPDQQARVVAHIPLTGLSAVDMAMQKKGNDKYYLYVQHQKDQGISIIDVSKPTQPKAIALIPWPRPSVSGSMSLTGDLAIIGGNATLASPDNPSEEDLVLWDLSNPAAPRVVQEFSGVVKWLQDERNFIYVLNGDGLWVISKPQERPEETEPWNTYGE
jgi:hypothetical protein